MLPSNQLSLFPLSTCKALSMGRSRPQLTQKNFISISPISPCWLGCRHSCFSSYGLRNPTHQLRASCIRATEGSIRRAGRSEFGSYRSQTSSPPLKCSLKMHELPRAIELTAKLIETGGSREQTNRSSGGSYCSGSESSHHVGECNFLILL